MHIAAQQNHADIVEILLKFGANPNIQTISGYTALHGARDKIIVGMLLRAGANPNIPNERWRHNFALYFDYGFGKL